MSRRSWGKRPKELKWMEWVGTTIASPNLCTCRTLDCLPQETECPDYKPRRPKTFLATTRTMISWLRLRSVNQSWRASFMHHRKSKAHSCRSCLLVCQRLEPRTKIKDQGGWVSMSLSHRHLWARWTREMRRKERLSMIFRMRARYLLWTACRLVL